MSIEIHIDYAADDSCMINLWARGHHSAADFLIACEAALRAWDEREASLVGRTVRQEYWRTVRAPAEVSSYGVCDFIHVPSVPGRGAYAVTVLADWLELHEPARTA